MNKTQQEWLERVEADRKRLQAMRADMAAQNGTEAEIAHRHGFATEGDLAAIMDTYAR